MATFTYTNAMGTAIPPGAPGITQGHTSQSVTALGTTGQITDVSVSLNHLTHTDTYDLDFLLVAPDGSGNLEFMSSAAGDPDYSASDLTLTLTDSATVALPYGTGPLVNGTYKPGDYYNLETDTDFGSSVGTVNHAAPNGSATFASSFDGRAPNGDWKLYINDHAGSDVGSLGSWSLKVSTSSDLAVVNGTGGADTLTITSTSATDGSFVLNGPPAVQYAGISSFVFTGGLGSDTFVGGSEADLVNGGEDNDSLSGRKGADTLRGDAGADTITGGKGADKMYAGTADAATDTFVYASKHDSGHHESSGWDKIFDFDRKNGSADTTSDKIDLSALHVNWDDVSLDKHHHNIRVEVDTNGHPHADMVIQVMDIDKLHKSDFIF